MLSNTLRDHADNDFIAKLDAALANYAHALRAFRIDLQVDCCCAEIRALQFKI